MRILFIGQKSFGADTLMALAAANVNIVGVVVGTNSLEREDPVEVVAKQCNVEYIKITNLKSPKVALWVSEKTPDLIVMAFVTLYMPMSLAELAPMGAINFHPSLLPLHRGISALPWTILSGDKQAGLSVYYLDDGIDTGDVIIQKSVDVTNDDDLKTLYFNKIYPLGIIAITEAIALIEHGCAPRIKQDEAQSTYEPPLKREHLLLNWQHSLEHNRRKIRAANPGIGAAAMLNGQEVRIFGCTSCDMPIKDIAVPGDIIGISQEGIFVQMLDGVLVITNLCYIKGEKQSAQQFAVENGLNCGDNFLAIF